MQTPPFPTGLPRNRFPCSLLLSNLCHGCGLATASATTTSRTRRSDLRDVAPAAALIAGVARAYTEEEVLLGGGLSERLRGGRRVDHIKVVVGRGEAGVGI